MWYVVGRLRMKPGRRDAFLVALQPMLEATRKEPGCLFFFAAAVADDPDGILIVEHFVDRAAHLAHQQTPHYLSMLPRFQADLASAEFEDIAASAVERSSMVGQ